MPFVAGNEIDAYCPQCQRDRTHTVIEVHSGLVHQVRCADCKEQHQYQRPHTPKKPAPSARSSRRGKGTTRKKKAPAELGPPKEWQDVIMGREPEAARKYSIKETFDLHDVIEHKNFGYGVVTAVAPDGKIEVAFREGRKKLVHDRT